MDGDDNVPVVFREIELFEVVDVVIAPRPNDDGPRGIRLANHGQNFAEHPIPQGRRQLAVRLVENLEEYRRRAVFETLAKLFPPVQQRLSIAQRPGAKVS